MAAQTLQESRRLPLAIALGALALLGSCARELVQADDLREAPKEYQQVIEAAPPVAPVAPAPTVQSSAAKPSLAAKTAAAPAAPKPLPTVAKPLVAKVVPAKSLPAKAPPAPATNPLLGLPTWKAKSWPYGVGEKIVWNFRWGLIEAGQARLEVLPSQMVDGQQVLHYRGGIRSTKMLELFYRVDNRIDSWISLDRHLPLRQEIEQLESKRWGRRVIVFDQKTGKSRFFQDMTKTEGKKREITKKSTKLTPGAQDIFGALYFYRFVEPGMNYVFAIHDRWKNWTAALTYLGQEELRVPAGKFDTYHYKVLPKLAGGLEPRGEVDVWLSKDDARVIVQFKAKIKLGSVTGELVEYEKGKPMGLPLPAFVTPLKPVVKAR